MSLSLFLLMCFFGALRTEAREGACDLSKVGA